MPDQNPNNKGKNLDQRIEELVSEMTEATEILSKQIEEAALSDEDFDLQAEIGSAVTPEDAANADPEEPSEEAEASEETEAADVPAQAESLDAQIEEMLEDAESASAETEPSKTQPRSAVDAVDAELAGLAEEMLDGDFDDADDVIDQDIEPTKEQPAASENDAPDEPASTEKQKPEAGANDEHESEDLLDGDFDDAEDVIEQGVEKEIQKPQAKTPEPEAAEDDAKEAQPAAKATEPVTEPEAASDSDSTEKPEQESKAKPTKARKSKKPKRIIEPKTDTKLPAFAAVAASRTNTIALALAEKINKPMDSKPTYMRDIAGWLAAVTLFNAFAVWVFLLIGRGPTAGTSNEPVVELVGETPATVEPN